MNERTAPSATKDRHRAQQNADWQLRRERLVTGIGLVVLGFTASWAHSVLWLGWSVLGLSYLGACVLWGKGENQP